MWNYWCCMKKKLLETGKHKSIRRNFWNTFLVLDIRHTTVFTIKIVCRSLFVTSDLPVLLYITWQMASHKGPSGKTSQETIWRGTFKKYLAGDGTEEWRHIFCSSVLLWMKLNWCYSCSSKINDWSGSATVCSICRRIRYWTNTTRLLNSSSTLQHKI